LGQQKRKEDDDCANCQTSIQASRGDVVVCQPPSSLRVPDELVEDESDDTPGKIGHWSRWRDVANTTEDDRGVQIPGWAPWETLRCVVKDDWKSGTNKPEVLQVRVETFARENAVRPNDTPDDGCGEEHATVGAGETSRLVRLADTVDIAKGPVQDRYLDDAAPERSNTLGKKE